MRAHSRPEAFPERLDRRSTTTVVGRRLAVLRRAVADLTAMADALESGEPVSEFFDVAAGVRSGSRVAVPEDPATVVTLDGDDWRERLLRETRTGLVVGADTAATALRVTYPPA